MESVRTGSQLDGLFLILVGPPCHVEKKTSNGLKSLWCIHIVLWN